jgi:acetyl-CoA C-acetyltransferase
MGNPVIVEAVRTAQGKRRGWLAGVHPAVLLGAAQVEVLKRSGIDPNLVDQVIGGCVTQAGEQSNNMVRRAWMHAGLPNHTASTVIDAQCSSAQQSTHLINALIKADAIKVGIACGIESMSRIPLGGNVPKGLGDPRPDGWDIDLPNQFEGADRIVKNRGFSRADVDAFGLWSQQKARAASDEGRFEREIVGVEAPVLDADGKPTGETRVVSIDQGIRADTTTASLGGLRPAFSKDGTITAGSASQISDGAAAVVVMSKAKAEELGLTWLAEIGASGQVAGPDSTLQLQPAAAIAKAVEKEGIAVSDIDLFELNEAFAAVGIASARELGVSQDVVNVNGGAIAIGHPVGMSGARIALHLALELKRRGGGIGAAALCGGGGQGDALIIRVPKA